MEQQHSMQNSLKAKGRRSPAPIDWAADGRLHIPQSHVGVCQNSRAEHLKCHDVELRVIILMRRSTPPSRSQACFSPESLLPVDFLLQCRSFRRPEGRPLPKDDVSFFLRANGLLGGTTVALLSFTWKRGDGAGMEEEELVRSECNFLDQKSSTDKVGKRKSAECMQRTPPRAGKEAGVEMLPHESAPGDNIVEHAFLPAQEAYVSIPGLPDELAMSCMARVPRIDHQNMRCVCRNWWNLLSGQEFWEMRRREALSEEWLYFYTERGHIWRAFDPAAEKWLRLPEMPFDNRIPGHSAFASIHGKIFVIGGNLWSFYDTKKAYVPCRRVSYFDLRSHRWKRAANLRIARARCMAEVVNGKLCVFGGYIEGMKNTTVTAEVYDPIANTWRFISSLEYPVSMRDSVVDGGKFYGVEEEGSLGFVFDSETGEWEAMAHGLSSGWNIKTTFLDGNLYTVGYEYEAGFFDDDGEEETNLRRFLKIYDPSEDDWEIVAESKDWPSVGIMMGFMGEGVELVTFRGMLCIVSVESDLAELGRVVISMVLLEVDISSEIPMCSLKFHKEFKVAADEQEPLAVHVKKCHVVAL